MISSARRLLQRAPVSVLKFGGSSVGNAEAIRRSGLVILNKREQGHKPVAVLSALYGVTNHLHDILSAARDGQADRVRDLRSFVLNKHLDTAAELLESRHNVAFRDVEHILKTQLEHSIDQPCSEILRHHQKKHTDNKVPPHQLFGEQEDLLKSAGERFSVTLMTAWMNHHRGLSSSSSPLPGLAVGVSTDAVLTTTPQSGGLAEPLLPETKLRADAQLQPLLDNECIPLLTGYLGACNSGIVRTLGRGGSDLTATVAARSLDAAEVELYKVECDKDKDGFMTGWQDETSQRRWLGVLSGDPSLCLDSHMVLQLSHSEASELSYFGKKVLHPTTMQPLVGRNIPTRIKNTCLPSLDGTVIVDDQYHLSPSTSSTTQSTTSQSLSPFSSSSSSSPVAVATLPLESLTQQQQKQQQHGESSSNGAAGPLSVVALVGQGIASSLSIAAQASQTLFEAGISSLPQPHAIGGDGCRAHSVAVLVREKDVPLTLGTLHRLTN